VDCFLHRGESRGKAVLQGMLNFTTKSSDGGHDYFRLFFA